VFDRVQRVAVELLAREEAVNQVCVCVIVSVCEFVPSQTHNSYSIHSAFIDFVLAAPVNSTEG